MPAKIAPTDKRDAFTLIEIAIVLVIIGLIVGGVLVGRSLVSAAAVRAQITQIEKFQQATHTFRGKYDYLPGDIKDPEATQFGFAPRGPIAGQGDGDGNISGTTTVLRRFYNNVSGESAMFWVDLSTAGLIDGGFSTANSGSYLVTLTDTQFGLYLPFSKISANAYVVVGTDGIYLDNYLYVIGVTSVTSGKISAGSLRAMTANQAYAIDTKTDDGLPGSGVVIAAWPDFLITTWLWSNGTRNNSTTLPTTAISVSASTCYDNAGVAGTPAYSIAQDSGSKNCSLSFRMR